MDLASISGIIAGIVLLGGAIFMGNNPSQFLSPSSLLIVLGGTLGGTVLKYSFEQLKNIPNLLKIIFKNKELHQETEVIEKIREFAVTARKEGILALEEQAKELDDPFLQKGIELVVDGTDPELVRSIMETKILALEERHKQSREIFETMGELAPAFGMIGTLIGLIQMLSQLSSPDKLGAGMSTALITTLYGAMFANMFFIPAAGKLKSKSEEEMLVREVMIEGILSIQAGENPHIIEEKLKAFLSTEHENKQNNEDERQDGE